MTSDNNAMTLSREVQESLRQFDKSSATPEVCKYGSRPCDAGYMRSPSGQARLTDVCKDTIYIQLHLDGVVIDDICFQTDGSDFAVACAKAATELVRDRPLSHALTITGKKIEEKLDGLPREHLHYAELAASTLRSAAQKALEQLDETLKAMYRH